MRSGRRSPGSGRRRSQYFNAVLQALRDSLMASLTEIFIIALAAVAMAFIINLFIKELPLRRGHGPQEPGQ